MTKLIAFTADAEQTSTYLTTGTATVEFQGKQVELPAFTMKHTVGTKTWTSTSVGGFAGRYETGAKIWRTRVDFNEAGKITQIRGGLDNRVRRNTCRLVGLWADTAEGAKSNHAGA